MNNNDNDSLFKLDDIDYLEGYLTQLQICDLNVQFKLSDEGELKSIIDEATSIYNDGFFKNEEDILHFLKLSRRISPFSTKILEMHKDYGDDKLEFYYRGVYDGVRYNLLPSCLRGERYGKECRYYNSVRTHCCSEFDGLSTLNALVKMQHYDCPTRLLDITTNPLVALYFACKDYNKLNRNNNNYGYVYVFANRKNAELYNESDKALIMSCISKMEASEQNEVYDACINKILKDGIHAMFDSKNNGVSIEKLYHKIKMERDFDKRIKAFDLLKNYYYIPDRGNMRVKLQSGCFIIAGLRNTQEKYNDLMNNEYFARIKIKNQEKILQELDRIGINEISLFPEIDKVARYYTESL